MVRFVSPSAASRATRSSAAVSDPGPLRTERRGRAPAATSSSRAAPREQAHPATLRLVEREPERTAGVGAAVGAAQGCAEVDQGPRVLEAGGRGGEHVDRALEQRQALGRVGARGQGSRPGAERAGDAGCLGRGPGARAPGAVPRAGSPSATCAATATVRQSDSTGFDMSSCAPVRPPRVRRRARRRHAAARAAAGPGPAAAGVRRTGPPQAPRADRASPARLRLAGLVELDQRVDQEGQRPEDRRRRHDPGLGLEREPRVRRGVADLPAPDPGEGPPHQAMGERDEPAPRCGPLDDALVESRAAATSSTISRRTSRSS